MVSQFIRGFIDGALSTLGVVVGASSASPPVVIAAGLGGSVANSISNILGAFSASRARHDAQLREFERAMVWKDLKGSLLERRIPKEAFKSGMIDGIATLLGGVVPVTPYFLAAYVPPLLTSIGMVLFLIFLTGLYIGKLSRENILFSGLKMILFGAGAAGIVYLMQLFIIH